MRIFDEAAYSILCDSELPGRYDIYAFFSGTDAYKLLKELAKSKRKGIMYKCGLPYRRVDEFGQITNLKTNE